MISRKPTARVRFWLHRDRCTVARLTAHMGLRGVGRGRKRPITTAGAGNYERPLDLVNRDFVATRPDQLWIADLKYLTTWIGFVYVASLRSMLSSKRYERENVT